MVMAAVDAVINEPSLEERSITMTFSINSSRDHGIKIHQINFVHRDAEKKTTLGENVCETTLVLRQRLNLH